MRSTDFLFSLSVFMLCFAVLALGQSSETGLPPFGSFHGSDFEMVSLKNGNLHVEIPLWRLPQRAAPNTGLRLVYDMPTWLVNKSNPSPTTTQWTVGPVSGEKVYWNFFSDPVHPAATTHDTITKTCFYNALAGNHLPFQYNVDINYVMTDSHGTKHPFNLRHVDTNPSDPCTDNDPSTDTGFTLDGSGYRATITGNNGNSVQYQTADDIGQFNGNLGSELSTGGGTTIQTDQNGAVLYRIDTVLDSNGNPQQFRVDYAPVPNSTNFCPLLPLQPFPSGTTCVESGFALNLPQKVTLPNGKFYQLTWSQDGNADLLRIDLPTGGYIAYAYQSQISIPPFQQGGIKQYKARRSVTSRTVSDGVLPPQQWAYLPGGIVQDPLGNQEVHSFGAPSGGSDGEGAYEVQVDYYQGAAGGALLRTIKNDYLAETDEGLPDSTPHGTINARLIRTTTILGDAAQTQTKTETDYETLTGTDGGTYTFLNPTEQREFAYGAGAPGGLLRRTDYTYLHTGNQNYLSRNIVHRVLSTTVYDGSNNQVAQTVNEYDNYSHAGQPMVASSAIQHDSTYNTAFIYRGNLTAVSHWRNTDSATLTTTNQYDDAGNLLSTIDPLGHKTTYDYADSWGNASCAPIGQAKVFATTVTNALSQAVIKKHNSCTATLASVTDPNSNSTTYSYDVMNRVATVDLPAGGHTENNYDDTQLLVTSSSRITSVASVFNRKHYDQLGRVVQTELCEDGTSSCATSIKTDTGYDGIGQVCAVSNPYRTANDPGPTNGTSSTTYDGIGRVKTITKQDGSIITISYNGACTVVTDEANKQRKSCSDALGRLVEVDEPGTPGPPPVINNHAIMQTDGNFVLDNAANTPLWSTGTGGTNAQSIFMQDDGNLVLYIFKWSAGIYATPTPGSYPQAACSIGTYLVAGQTLPSGSCIASPHWQYFLYMAPDGNLYIYNWATGAGTWGPGTQGHPGAYAKLETTGNFVVYTSAGAVLWSSGTAGTNAERLDMEDDGRIIIYKSAWNSGTSTGQFNYTTLAHPGCDVGIGTGTTGTLGSGQCFVSPNGHFELLLQTDGNLVINDLSATPNQMLWSTNTGLPPVDPAFSWRTLYTYDALGNLTCVEQHGNVPTGTTGATGCADPPSSDATSPWRVRRFTYNSLSQLLTAKNPESGTISYTYDNDGNLLQKTSPAPNPNPPQPTQTISYCYDALHRVTGRAYSAQNCTNGLLPQGTAVVSYFYDAGTNGVGRMTSLADQAGTGSYTYDAMGRISSETRTLPGVNNAPVSQSLSYDYNLDGSLSKLHYPSGTIVTYTADLAGRATQAADGNGINYVTGATYSPGGALTSFVSGSSGAAAITNLFSYNRRLQPCRMTASTGALPVNCADADPTHSGNVYDITYDFHAGNSTAGSGADNGNVFGIINNKDATRSQAFAYDGLNRLISAQNAGTDCSLRLVDGNLKFWGNDYTYDAWGNLTNKTKKASACAGEGLSVNVDVNNRLLSGYGYDAAGNLTYDPTPGHQLNYIYDAENRLTGASGYTYAYDGDGNRVRKSNGNTASSGTLYWEMTPGVVAETDLAGTAKSEYIFFDGDRVARRDGVNGAGGVFYYFSDHLKTASVITDSAGTIKAESDYYPWGGELQFVNNDSNDYKFTGKKRDLETGLDYFGARYYSNALGRFMTPDKPFADQHPQNPQSWNMYMYVYNNPLRLVDDTGQGAKPADDARINQYFQKAVNTSIRTAIQATNNYSIGAFESEMSQGANYLGPKLLGAAGEAVMFNRLADANPFGGVSFQPRIGDNDPDLKVSFEPTMYSDTAALTNIVGQPGGTVPMEEGSATMYFEVKVGSDFSNLMKGAKQAADTAEFLDPKANTASVLVVDKGAYNALSADQQTQLKIVAGGAYIQLQPNLNRDAAALAAKTRKEACAASDKCK